ncbi:MAG: universal stress protein [Pseudomonadota bacterium]
MFKTILLSYDGSDHAQNALATALTVAKTFGAKLGVAHTPQMDTPPIVVGAFVGMLEKPPTQAQIAEAGEHVLAEVRKQADAAGVQLASTHIGKGDPAQHTLSVAKELDADLIVMGRRGLGAVGSLALGSVSQAVSHGASCACLTVV